MVDKCLEISHSPLFVPSPNLIFKKKLEMVDKNLLGQLRGNMLHVVSPV